MGFSETTPCSIHIPLLQGETAGDYIASWPHAVQTRMARELDMFAHRNPDLDITEQSCSIDPVRRICVLSFIPRAAA